MLEKISALVLYGFSVISSLRRCRLSHLAERPDDGSIGNMKDRDACLLETVDVLSKSLVLLLHDLLQVPDGPWTFIAALDVGDERVRELLPGLDRATYELVHRGPAASRWRRPDCRLRP